MNNELIETLIELKINYNNINNLLRDELNALIRLDYEKIEKINDQKKILSDEIIILNNKREKLVGNENNLSQYMSKIKNLDEKNTLTELKNELNILLENIKNQIQYNTLFLNQSIASMEKFYNITKKFFFNQPTYNKNAKNIQSAQKGLNLIKNY